MSRTTGQIPQAMQECIAECSQCHNTCLETVSHCLELGGPHADPAHIGLLLDCTDICRVSADVMLRGSERHVLTCGVCAEVCEACSDDCERMAGGDAVMLRCAEVCRRCASSCRRLAA
jgi:hypothetical protein